jgi:uncharacterized membrane protein YbhN (UPF0104 family)
VSQSRRWLRWVTGISLLIGVVALIITIGHVGIGTIIDHLTTIGWWFGVLLAIELVSTLFDAGAVYLMTRGRSAPSYYKVCVAQFAGRAVNLVTPAANVGEALKVGLLARAAPTRRVTAAIMFVAFASTIVSLVIVAIGSLATAFLFELPTTGRFALGVAGGVAAVIAIALVALVRRGVLVTLAHVARRLRLISQSRLDRWQPAACEIDNRLRGQDLEVDHRLAAGMLLVISNVLQRAVVWIAIVAAGYSLGTPQLIAILSAGVVLGWISTLVPLGVGVAEGGNAAMFAVIGAPASLGVALALARRMNQIVFALLGFGVLAIDRIASPHTEPPSEDAHRSAPSSAPSECARFDAA